MKATEQQDSLLLEKTAVPCFFICAMQRQDYLLSKNYFSVILNCLFTLKSPKLLFREYTNGPLMLYFFVR